MIYTFTDRSAPPFEPRQQSPGCALLPHPLACDLEVFCAGDGLTPEGERQTILAPDDATRLDLGRLARFSCGDPPGWYGDNSSRTRSSATFCLDWSNGGS